MKYAATNGTIPMIRDVFARHYWTLGTVVTSQLYVVNITISNIMLLLTETITHPVWSAWSERDATRHVALFHQCFFSVSRRDGYSKSVSVALHEKKKESKKRKSDSLMLVKRGVAIRCPERFRRSHYVDFPASVFISRLNCKVETSRNGIFLISFFSLPSFFTVPLAPIFSFLQHALNIFSDLPRSKKR